MANNNNTLIVSLIDCWLVVLQDPNKVGAGTKWFVGIAMLLVTAAIAGVTVYLYKKSSARRDYVEIP